MSGRSRSWCIALLGYLVVAGVMTSPLFEYRHINSATYEGDARAIIWTLAWDNHAVLDRAASLFDANMFFPAKATLALNEHLFGISLFTLPIYAATHNPILAYNLVWWFVFVANALAARQLAWRLTRDPVAAFTAGLVYAFSFYMMLHGHGHLNLIWVFWVPLAVLFAETWIEHGRWRDAALLAICVILQVLSSWYVGAMLLLALALRITWAVVWQRKHVHQYVMRRVCQAALFSALAVASIWPFARHYQALDEITPSVARSMSADTAGYLVPPQNTWAGRLWQTEIGPGPREIWGEQTVFAGWMALAFAVIGACVAIARRHVGATFFVALGVLAVSLSFGPSVWAAEHNTWGWTPFGLFAHVPFMSLFRAPARFAFLAVLATSMLSAVAVARLSEGRGLRFRMLVCVVWVVMLGESFVVDFPAGRPVALPVPSAYAMLRSLPEGAVVSLPIYRNSAHWFREGDYMLFSTVHWRPTVNGMARVEPADTRWVANHMKAFPGVNSAASMRRLGIRWVVLDAARYPDGAGALIEEARASPDFQVVARDGAVWLFEVIAKQ